MVEKGVVKGMGCKVLRGGSWNNKPQNLRASNRNRNEPAKRNNNNGFRLSLSFSRQYCHEFVPRCCASTEARIVQMIVYLAHILCRRNPAEYKRGRMRLVVCGEDFIRPLYVIVNGINKLTCFL
ncbi:MAG: hypothetical protein HY026_06195 [Deltaproteobacteria bacterium]|nr:hypothetical protein [Deltaproteobacteria bacterium]